MNAATIVGLVEGSLSLAVQCGSAAKSLNSLVGQYKYAKLTISTMVQNLDIMQIAWDRIGTWSKDFIPTDDDALIKRLERFLETGSLVLDALEEDLRSYDVSQFVLHATITTSVERRYIARPSEPHPRSGTVHESSSPGNPTVRTHFVAPRWLFSCSYFGR